MELSRRTVRSLVVLLAVSLLGLIGLQAVLLAGVRRQKDQTLDHAARAAVELVARQLDAGEVATHVVARVIAAADSSGAAPCWQTVRAVGGRGVRVVHLGAASDSLAVACLDTAAIWVPDLADSLLTGKSQLVRQILLDLSGQMRRPVTERVTVAAVDSLLSVALAAAGLDVAAQWAVREAGERSLALSSAGADTAARACSPLAARLFPTDILPPAYDLVVHLPGRVAWTWRQTAPLLMGSVLLTLLVVLCAVFAVRTILAQRRFAAELVTFVDNLTHEFKTPLATMALASEAIGRDDVRREPGTLARYAGMIGDEVRRLREHVDRILQAAHLERGEVALETIPLDAHEVLGPVLDGFALQIAARGGTLGRRLDAAPCLVRADPVHLAGMVSNLLDNAVKYSPGAPDVEFATAAAHGRLVITVRDRGRGVPARDRERVFERYFRVQVGDRHDVKGSGLGLSYVRRMATLHGGTVVLQGRSGGGTEVVLSLPLRGEVAP